MCAHGSCSCFLIVAALPLVHRYIFISAAITMVCVAKAVWGWTHRCAHVLRTIAVSDFRVSMRHPPRPRHVPAGFPKVLLGCVLGHLYLLHGQCCLAAACVLAGLNSQCWFGCCQVGYGDIYPATDWGRMVVMVLIVVMLVQVPIYINKLSEFFEEGVSCVSCSCLATARR